MNSFMTPYRRRRFRWGRWLFLLLLIGAGSFFFYKWQTGNVITVDPGTTLYIDECDGYVHIHPNSSTNQVILQGLGSMFVSSHHALDSNTMIINGCDLDMTVPSSINLKINASEIDVFGVSGQMNLDCNGGPINLIQTTLTGKSLIENNGGSIVFLGGFDAGSLPTFSSNGGTLDVSLKKDAALHLKLTGILDAVSSNIPGIVSPTGIADTTDIGSNPQSTLTLDVNGTALVLQTN
ncbi:hypothetical protein [Tengunoibacter tsumagoiensis]|uniref:Adhesin domain-containing protein n=1 Tax=Tengunoibacter tsumagoiensis TaxID=2014871 RepID=A0A401ZVA3_9CHLR|nr:hypothetical protein [Tengunoibacter tsumagoiensis]GCE10654.1 hypothetical protein KTT_05130 [Tengunoibacter tsumagoiensis]